MALLEPAYFFCQVQPVVLAAHRCAGEDTDCHADRSALRLDLTGETDAPPLCENDVPVGPVPASYYTNLARVRGEVRSTAARSDLYVRPLGRDHPVTLFREDDPEAAILRAWIEGTP